jgi:hypothetical protein
MDLGGTLGHAPTGGFSLTSDYPDGFSLVGVATNPQQPVAGDLAKLTRALIDAECTGARQMRELTHKEHDVSFGMSPLTH